MFSVFHPLLAHYKVGDLRVFGRLVERRRFQIGAISLQLLEGELRRYDAWRVAATAATSGGGEQQRKLELAIRKQELLIVECIKILINLAAECRNEAKMVRRGLLNMLVDCINHSHSPLVRKTAALFLWKLSVFAENKNALAVSSLGVVERLVELLAPPPSAATASGALVDAEMTSICFALLFNLSFDSTLRARMANVALLNCVAAQISCMAAAAGGMRAFASTRCGFQQTRLRSRSSIS